MIEPTHRRTSRSSVMIAAAAVVAVLLAAPAPAATRAAVTIESFAFTPATLTVPVGTTVTWTNRDEESHTVTSTTGAFGSSGLSRDETFEQTFTRPGTYEYFCALHPHMRATLIVR